VSEGCHLKDRRCGKVGVEMNVRGVVVACNVDVAVTGSHPVTFNAYRFFVVWRNIPRIIRFSE
jgi:hypothetical protein